MNLSDQLTDAIDAQNALTQAVADKMGQVGGSVGQFQGRVDQLANDIAAQMASTQAVAGKVGEIDGRVAQLSDDIAAQMASTQAVAGKVGEIDGRIEQFVKNWGIDGYTTLEVGAGKPFDSILAAWDSLIGKTLKADVLIKVADGVYTTTGFTLTNQPFAQRIRIEGNVGDPDACQIKFTPDANGASHGVIFDNVRNVVFSGFKLIGEVTDKNWTIRCLLIHLGSRVWSAPGSVQIEGGAIGLAVSSGAQYECKKLHISNTRQWGVLLGSGARAFLESLRLAGPGKDVKTTFPARLYDTESTQPPHGLGVMDTAQCWAFEAHITGYWHAAFVTRSSYLWCDLVKIERCEYGGYAAYGGVLWSYWSPAAPGRPERRPSVDHANVGFFADFGGKVIAIGAIAKHCRIGFHAGHHSLLYASASYASRCSTSYSSHAQSMVLANDVTLYDWDTDFTPPNSDVPGNGNAIIRYSNVYYHLPYD
ncbi:MAG: hypothetical protein EPN70_21505 [Paraburkholderia sp.]|uniref:hypothetical protein n=1 Tax=Paraburkholderia sp. TaxID=1926495 RepID=UPI001220FC94|nr:hypothetical protein [Paraburkholderia sp.]TAM00809.1 MAG: hypothetical protein EPN70_21505 [Paraburkholderia sp.]